MSDENLISLKDASQISGYTPDYIGQLIRSGKIPGKQIYTGITWMTTADAVMAYKNKSKGNNSEQLTENWLTRQRRKLKMEWEIIKLFFQTFRSTLPILFIILSAIFILLIYFGIQLVTKTGYQQNKNLDNSEAIFSY